MPSPILIITRDFPPYCNRVGWMIRAASLANFLAAQGGEVHVLCHERAKTWDLYRVDPKVNVHPVRDFLAYYDLPRDSLGPLGLCVKLAKRVVLRTLGARLVDFEDIFSSSIEREANRVIESSGIGNVIVSSPPHSLQTVGVRLKERYGDRIRLFVDLRDPWSIRPKHQKASPQGQASISAKEARVFDVADTVAVVSSGMAKAYARLYSHVAAKITIVGNGFIAFKPQRAAPEVAAFAQGARAEGRVVAGYFGVGGVGRPRTDAKELDALFDVFAADRSLAKKFALVIQGDFLVERAIPLGLKILLLPPTGNAQARDNMATLDLGIVLYTQRQDAAVVLGGKIYDYMAAGIGVWYLVPDNAESIFDLAKETAKPFIADVLNRTSLEESVREILALQARGELASRFYTAAEASGFSRDEQYKKVLTELR